jgi:hypothetical protein
VPRTHLCECVADPNFQTPTPTATPPAAGTPNSPTVPPCPGDCDGSGAVGINELLAAVAVTLGGDVEVGCAGFDRDLNGSVALNELISLVNLALDGCR